jgi:hypothetical protein
MSKRKNPIIQAKLQKIEQQSEFICVFHCSGVRPPQWRHLKNVLSKTKGNTFFKPGFGRAVKGAVGFVPRTQLTKSPPGPFCILYSSTIASASPSPYGLIAASYNTEWNFNHYNRGAAGKPQGGRASHPWAELQCKIGDLESNTNLVFLYAQIHSTVINHIDIHQAMQLNTRSVLAQFWRSIHEPSQRFRDCLRQATIEFMQYQERRRCSLDETPRLV